MNDNRSQRLFNISEPFFMGFISNIFKSFGWVKKEEIPLTSGIGFYDWLTDTGINKKNLLDNVKGWPWICSRAIAEEVGKIELRLMQIGADGTEEEIFEHELFDLIYKPNNFLSKNELFEHLSMHLDFTGNAYWFLEGVKKEGDKPTAIVPLNPKYISIKKGKWPNLVLGYKYSVDGHTQDFQPWQILHFKLPNPNDIYEGKGILESIADWVDTENYATEWNRLFFLNSARPDIALETDTELSKEQMEILRTSFEAVYKGVKNAHKVALMPKGTKVNDFSKSHKDMDFTELDRIYRDKILAGFRTPHIVLGLGAGENLNRAVAETSNYVFALRTIKPRMARIVEYLNEFLAPRYGANLYLNFVDPVPENKELELEEYNRGLAGHAYMTINEVREKEGLPPIDNGDSVLTSFALIPLGEPIEKKVVMTEKPQTKKKRIKISERRQKELSAGTAKDAVSAITPFLKNELPDDQWEVAWKQFVIRVTPYEKALAEAIKKNDARITKEALDKLKNEMKQIGVDDLIDEAGEVKVFIKISQPILFELFQKEAKAALELIGIDSEFDFSKVREQLLKAVSYLAKNYTSTTVDLVKKELEEGLREGEGLDDLTGRLMKVKDFSEEFRAARVARTETFRTGNSATKAAWRQSGVVKTLKWYTAADGRVCEFCAPLHDKTIKIEEDWFDKGDTITGSDGGKLEIDYVDIENPPLHAGCRCYLRPDVIEI